MGLPVKIVSGGAPGIGAVVYELLLEVLVHQR